MIFFFFCILYFTLKKTLQSILVTAPHPQLATDFPRLGGQHFSDGGNRTGSILKAGLHFGPDCGL